jgi:hypothetical protein
MSRARLGLTLVVLLTSASVYGCGDDLLQGVGPVDELTADLGQTLRDEVESALSSLTLGSSLDPIGTTQAPPDAASLVAVPCVNPSSAADSDGDGVPDDATYVFTAPPCRFTGWRGGTFDIVGSLRIQDPSATHGFGYEATLTGLRSRFTSADAKVIYDVTRNGTRTLSGSVSGLTLTADLQLIRTFAGHPDAAVDKQWSLNFTPATQLQINTPLPSGSLDIAGTIDWTRGTEHLVLTVATPTPLEYDAGCTDTVQRIRAGDMTATGTFGDTEGLLRIRWRGCGSEPEFSFESTE